MTHRTRLPPPRWRSPVRGPWLTAVLSAVLLAALPLVAITGLLDYVAYGPRLGQARPADVGFLHLPLFDWPTRPQWLFAVTEGLHVTLGIVIIPVVLAKLWSVMPRLFAWPPAGSAAQALERLSLLAVVGGIWFEIVTGLLNIQYDYVFGFSFYTAHYYGAWVFIAGLAVHVALKSPRLVRSLRDRSPTDPPPRPSGASATGHESLVAADPGPATMSRRAVLGMVGGGSALLALLTAGQAVGDSARPLALLLPRGRGNGDGPNGFPVNKTARATGVPPEAVGRDWRLRLRLGERRVSLDRSQLLAMPQHTARLTLGCVEGWSTTQTWTGVRLRDLAGSVGARRPVTAHVVSVARRGTFNSAVLAADQVDDPDAMLALRVNGADLSLDHGFPARVIVPALPGVHNTKWVGSITFEEA